MLDLPSKCFNKIPAFPRFFAALAALGLPWSSVIDVYVLVLDSKPSRPNRNLAKLRGVMKKHDLTNKTQRQDKCKHKDDDNDNDNYI